MPFASFACICSKMHRTAHTHIAIRIFDFQSDNERYCMEYTSTSTSCPYIECIYAIPIGGGSVWWWCGISYTSASEVSEPKMHEHERIGLRFAMLYAHRLYVCVWMWSLYTDRVKRMFNILYSLHLYIRSHSYRHTNLYTHVQAFAHSVTNLILLCMARSLALSQSIHQKLLQSHSPIHTHTERVRQRPELC